jgi:uncharacterized protein
MQLHKRLLERGIAIDIMVNDVGHELQGPFVDGPLDTALAMVQLDIASLTAVTRFLRKTEAYAGVKFLLVASLLAC